MLQIYSVVSFTITDYKFIPIDIRIYAHVYTQNQENKFAWKNSHLIITNDS